MVNKSYNAYRDNGKFEIGKKCAQTKWVQSIHNVIMSIVHESDLNNKNRKEIVKLPCRLAEIEDIREAKMSTDTFLYKTQNNREAD